MSEPVKKHPQETESYAPKDRPAIIDIAAEASTSTASQLQPAIITKKFTLAGLEARMDLNTDFSAAIETLRSRLRAAVADIPGKVPPVRLIGFWQPGGVYFAGIEVSNTAVMNTAVSNTAVSEAGADLNGFVVKDLPESLFAVFREKRRGTLGGRGGYAYNVWYPTSGYDISEALPGDFEIFDDLTHCGEFDECDILIPLQARQSTPETYAPKDRPAIINMAEQAKRKGIDETLVEQVDGLCAVVDRGEILMVGIGVPVSFESPGYGGGGNEYTLNDYFIAKKYIGDGTIALLARALGVPDAEIICARTDIRGDGNYTAVIGVAVDSLDRLPDFLPENTVTLTIPAGRYAKLLINEQKREGRKGYPERMNADEFFTRDFRKQTPYVYNKEGTPMYVFDGTGDIVSKYEPVKLPAEERERWDTIEFTPVLLPEMKIACSVSPPDGEFVIMKYFAVEEAVHKTGLTRFYRSDYYGFPISADNESGYVSAFGSRVTSFEGLPDCVEKLTMPGGLYIHITQLEFNGDSPDMPYEVAFGHLKELYLDRHPDYDLDMTRKVIARFRQGNCASVFVPVRKA
jgi:predicted transcriptional regulator YdeE